MNKHIVCLSDGGRVENIIDASGLYDLFLEWILMADAETRKEERFRPIDQFMSKINTMELRMRYNSQRNPVMLIVDIDMEYGELWDKLELDGDFNRMIRKTSTPFHKD